MTPRYAITILAGRVAELFHADQAPAEAVPVSDDDGEMLRRSGRFADWAVSTEGVLDHDPLPPTAEDVQRAADAAKLAADRTAAFAYSKLVALSDMTPAQIQTWIGANVTNLAQAQDAIGTLAIGLSILIRRERKGL
jgi:hypothetical protein